MRRTAFTSTLPASRSIPRALALLCAFLASASALAQISPSTGRSTPPAPSEDTALREEYAALWERGDYAKALNSLDARIESVRRIPLRWVLDRAELRFDLGNVDGAISDMENILRQVPKEPEYMLRMAEYYKARGRMEDYRSTLTQAKEQARLNRQGWTSPNNVVAQARILGLLGEDPKKILSSMYTPTQQEYPDYPGGFSAAGELALEKGDWQLAAEYFDKALKVDARHMPALEGLAEAHWKSGDPRLEDTLARIDKINPRDARVCAIRVESLLDAGKLPPALEMVEMGLSINTRDYRLVGLKAAALFLQGKPEEMENIQRETLKFNPAASEVQRIPGVVASTHYRFKEGADFQRKALEIDPEDWRAKANLALDLLRLGREEEGRKALDEAFEADRYNVQLYNMSKLMKTLDHYATVERGPFILKIPKAEEALLADDMLGLLEEAFARYQEKYKIRLETPILVQAFDNHDDFMVRSIGLPGQIGYMGICFGHLITMDSPSAWPKWAANWRAVLWHEFVHVVTLQKTKNRMPRWLSEGISVYEETERAPAWGQRMDVQYKAIVAAEPPPGLRELEGFFAHPKSPNHLMFGYFLSAEFVRFYCDRYGFDALVRALDLMAEGGDDIENLAKAAGKSFDVVDDDFRAHMKERFAPFDNLPKIAKPIPVFPGFKAAATTPTLKLAEIAAEGSPFSDALDAGGKALGAKDWDAAERELKKAAELFPDYTGRDAPLRLLIDVYEGKGDRAALREALRRQIAFAQSDFVSCRKLVNLLREDGAWDEVAVQADWALGIDPFDVPMRKALVEAYQRTGRAKEALVALRQLAALDAPRSIDYRLSRIETLIGMEDWDTAKRETVALLEETPHSWKAQELLLRIVERKGAQGGAE